MRTRDDLDPSAVAATVAADLAWHGWTVRLAACPFSPSPLTVAVCSRCVVASTRNTRPLECVVIVESRHDLQLWLHDRSGAAAPRPLTQAHDIDQVHTLAWESLTALTRTTRPARRHIVIPDLDTVTAASGGAGR